MTVCAWCMFNPYKPYMLNPLECRIYLLQLKPNIFDVCMCVWCISVYLCSVRSVFGSDKCTCQHVLDTDYMVCYCVWKVGWPWGYGEWSTCTSRFGDMCLSLRVACKLYVYLINFNIPQLYIHVVKSYSIRRYQPYYPLTQLIYIRYHKIMLQFECEYDCSQCLTDTYRTISTKSYILNQKSSTSVCCIKMNVVVYLTCNTKL
jgi:hypothetical protein